MLSSIFKDRKIKNIFMKVEINAYRSIKNASDSFEKYFILCVLRETRYVDANYTIIYLFDFICKITSDNYRYIHFWIFINSVNLRRYQFEYTLLPEYIHKLYSIFISTCRNKKQSEMTILVCTVNIL